MRGDNDTEIVNSVLTSTYVLKNFKYTKKLKNEPDINKFLGILFVCGSAFHSTTFEFTKLLFTDVFYNKKFNETFLLTDIYLNSISIESEAFKLLAESIKINKTVTNYYLCKCFSLDKIQRL